MGDAWFIGPFLIQEKWGLYALAFIISYLVLRFVIKRKGIDVAIIDPLWNSLFYFFIVWKFSYALFYPKDVIENPISQLYFTGGDKGLVLGLIAVVFYFYWKGKRSSFSFHHYMELGMIAILTGLGVYRGLVWAFYLPSQLILLVDALFPLAIVILLFRLGREHWAIVLAWFSLGALFLSYFKPDVAILLGFSLQQLIYITVALLCFSLVLQKRRVGSA